MKKSALCLLLCALVTLATAQDDDQSLFEMSLEELMNINVTVASRKGVSQREAPGILTIITADEIKKSGARDMFDILRTVPGINLNSDVQGMKGITIRGNWGYEGKVLIMIDGQELNENLYSTGNIGGIPVDQIYRIEIIRGPGSSIYGGYAELGVINVITKSAENSNGLEVSSMASLSTDELGTTNVNFNLSKSFGDLKTSLLGSYGQSTHSYNHEYIDFYGDTAMLSAKNAFDETMLIAAGVNYKGFAGKIMYDGYSSTSKVLFDAVTPEPYNIGFGGLYGELKYDVKLSDKFSITPQYNFKQQKPWNSTEEFADKTDKVVNKHSLGIHFSGDFSDNINVVAGTLGYLETALDNLKEQDFPGQKDELSYTSFALYAQGMWKQPYFNATVGGRFDTHEKFGGAFAPRIGFTKAFNKFHYKALYSHAFRAPGIMNLSLEPDIKPETTVVYEVEAGYTITPNLLFAVNVFDITINKPILYLYDDDTDTETYFNGDKTGSMGSEINIKWQKDQNFVNAGYSIYFAAGKNTVESYTVENKNNALVGRPQHKFTLNSSWRLFKNGLFFNSQFIFLGNQWAYTSIDNDGNAVISEINSKLIVNLNFLYRNAFVEGLDMSVGVYDLLNTKPMFYQAYNGYLPPYPGKHRELFFKLAYNFDFGK
jgi:outer membrane receptor for ferrienterochelin and colicin